ncbi:hypothetical protein BX661DRAFT_188771 [Kickxella alabastrina]|uniref:uncharacterized protein n=1 Tax=Kickxella alabastrina TaxID=61397 RepID=UPI00221F66B3|nr:uncharacterized protein BX661DRAFT_188771 [Kickxella alabastrina]KAI7820905.1 hypothetical protein BX661DRAFT_188771 [Kickxella alabastrina]
MDMLNLIMDDEELFQGVNGITIRQICTSVYYPRGLTSAVPSGRNVASLKTLSLRYLIYRQQPHWSSVIYQYLESFEHIFRDNPDVSAVLESPAAAAVSQPTNTIIYFPALKSFKLSGPYPFVDDAPFRGNSRTLERLDININELIDIADKFCIFTGCKFSSVQYIGLTYVTPYLITRQDLETRFRDLEPLQVIEFPILSLEFADIVAIMRHAPYFQKLSCLPTNVAPKIWRHVNGISAFPWLTLNTGSRTMTMNGRAHYHACPQFIGVKLSLFDRRKYKNIDRLAGYKYLSEFAERFKLFSFRFPFI